jgi:muramoyltetrapeptide carboxypeptidase
MPHAAIRPEPVPASLVAPRALQRGDTIGVAHSSYEPDNARIQRGVGALEEAGFSVILDSELHKPRRFSRKEDERRAQNFMALWADPRVAAVIVGTGGYGAVRMLPYLDPELFRRDPKPFVGYSDVTALHLWLMRRAGLRTFHGPTVDDLIPGGDDLGTSTLITALTAPRPATDLGKGLARSVRPGIAIGRLVGGNISLVEQSVGTAWEIDTDGAVLFIEETKDPMSYVDERLLHLRNAGLLRGVRGIVFGKQSLDRSEEGEFENFLLDLVADLDVPIVTDFPAGHEEPNLTLPLGTDVELVADDATGWLRYREEALAECAPAAAPERPAA